MVKKKPQEEKDSKTKKLAKGVIKRIGLAFIVSIIPWIGDIIPCYTIATFFELKTDNDFVSPTSLIMLLFSFIIDLTGVFTFFLSFIGLGILVSWFFDLVGLLFIGGWMLFRMGKS